MEQNVLRMLDGMISTTDDPEILQELEHHKLETEGHVQRMRQRLEAHGASPSTVRQMTGIVGALAKMPLDLVRGDKAGRNARDGYTTEHMEIAAYELLERVAQRAGDDETASACDEIIAQERADGDDDRAELGQVRRAVAEGRGRPGVAVRRGKRRLPPDLTRATAPGTSRSRGSRAGARGARAPACSRRRRASAAMSTWNRSTRSGRSSLATE